VVPDDSALAIVQIGLRCLQRPLRLAVGARSADVDLSSRRMGSQDYFLTRGRCDARRNRGDVLRIGMCMGQRQRNECAREQGSCRHGRKLITAHVEKRWQNAADRFRQRSGPRKDPLPLDLA
jgi:hypothetical protein